MESNRIGKSLTNNIRNHQLKKLGGSGSGSFGLGLNDLTEIIDEYFRIYQLEKSAIPITEYTKKLIRKHLLEKVDSGTPLNDAIRDFTELAISGTPRSPSFSEMRAKRIATTETTRAMNFGGLIGAYMSGVDVDKVWITSDDERVRHNPRSHVRLDRVVAPMMSAFYNGESIKYPGDPEASTANTANCRCSLFYVEKPRPKPKATRVLSNFLSDFLSGFIVNNIIDFFVNQQQEVENG
jgi:hypothetical protein